MKSFQFSLMSKPKRAEHARRVLLGAWDVARLGSCGLRGCCDSDCKAARDAVKILNQATLKVLHDEHRRNS